LAKMRKRTYDEAILVTRRGDRALRGRVVGELIISRVNGPGAPRRLAIVKIA
jgi:hypothetical protein